jgi:hypothetical protein
VLCFRCNYIIGSRWGVTPEVLDNLAAYLRNPPARELGIEGLGPCT